MMFLLLTGLGTLLAGASLMLLPRVHVFIAGLLLFSGLGILGLACMLISLPDIYNGWQSQRWPTVSAQVISSRASSVMPIRAGNPLWRADVRYRYQLDSQWYESSQTDFGGLASVDKEWIEEQLQTLYSPGRVLQIRYNPEQVLQAVITPGIQARASILFILGLAFTGIACWQLRDLLRDWHGDRL